MKLRRQKNYCYKCWPKRKEGGKDIGGIVLFRTGACELGSQDQRCVLGFDKK